MFSIGVAEVALIVFAIAFSAMLAAGARFISSKRPANQENEPPSPPFPIVLPIVAVVSVLAAPGVGWLLAPFVVDYVIASVPSDASSLILHAESDLLLARVYGVVLVAAWGIVPGLAIVAWFVLSSRRSTVGAVVFATATWIGFSLGVAAGLALVPSALSMLTSFSTELDGPSEVAPMLGLVHVMSMAVRGPLGFGVCGACIGGVWVIAASSRRGLRAALFVSVTLPFFACLISALATPPDPASQIMLAFLIVVGWLIGLGGGAATRAIVSRGAAE